MTRPRWPRRELKGRYYTYSELATEAARQRFQDQHPEDEDREPSLEEVLGGSAFGQVYGRSMHAYIAKKVTKQLYRGDAKVFECSQGQRDIALNGWHDYWHRHLVNMPEPPGAKVLQNYYERGIARGRHDLDMYLTGSSGHKPLSPEMVEVFLENVKIDGAMFHLTVSIDQLRLARDRDNVDCIVELKFNDCTAETFREVWAPRYELQLQSYTIAYRNYVWRNELGYRVGTKRERAAVLWHVPSGFMSSYYFSDEELVQTLKLLKQVEKEYWPRKRKERETRELLAAVSPEQTRQISSDTE